MCPIRGITPKNPITKRSSIHKLQLIFVNAFVAPIALGCLTYLNIIHICMSVCDVIDLKCCSWWAANESNFFPVLGRRWISEKLQYILFLSICCVLPM